MVLRAPAAPAAASTFAGFILSSLQFRLTASQRPSLTISDAGRLLLNFSRFTERRLDLIELYEIAAGIIKYGSNHRPCFCWLHRKYDAQILQSFVLFSDIVNGKCRMRYSLLVERLLVSLGCRVVVRFKHQLNIIRSLRRNPP